MQMRVAILDVVHRTAAVPFPQLTGVRKGRRHQNPTSPPIMTVQATTRRDVGTVTGCGSGAGEFFGAAVLTGMRVASMTGSGEGCCRGSHTGQLRTRRENPSPGRPVSAPLAGATLVGYNRLFGHEHTGCRESLPWPHRDRSRTG